VVLLAVLLVAAFPPTAIGLLGGAPLGQAKGGQQRHPGCAQRAQGIAAAGRAGQHLRVRGFVDADLGHCGLHC
jgi:hypothetical protein